MDPPGPSRGPGEEWPQAGLQGEQASLAAYLDLFSEDFLLNEALDPSTLAAVNAVQASSPGDEQAAKARKRLKQEPEVQGNALPCSGSQDNGSNDDEIDNSDIDDEPTKKSGLRRKNSTAAINKASREKARREKINDRFGELARLVEPGKEPKNDKLSVLCEAIRFVQQIQVENSQLKQLNKFLEEKVAQHEKERGQMLYQMYQMNANSHMPAGGQMNQGMMINPMMAQAMPNMQMAGLAPQTSMDQTAAGSFCVPGKPVMPPVGNMPMPYWQSMMPQSMLDSRQDSLLRPPAA
eukprot:jgi/Chrzof1/4676/Cz14g22130.t1